MKKIITVICLSALVSISFATSTEQTKATCTCPSDYGDYKNGMCYSTNLMKTSQSAISPTCTCPKDKKIVGYYNCESK